MRPLPAHLRWPLLAAAALLAAGALPVGAGLARHPDGSSVGLPLAVLRGTPFADFLVPGLLLAGAVGTSTLAAAALLLLGRRRAPEAALVAGAVVTGWIATQVALLGYLSPLQPAVAFLGLVLLALGWLARRAVR